MQNEKLKLCKKKNSLTGFKKIALFFLIFPMIKSQF